MVIFKIHSLTLKNQEENDLALMYCPQVQQQNVWPFIINNKFCYVDLLYERNFYI